MQTYAGCQTLPCAKFCTPPKLNPVENFPHPPKLNPVKNFLHPHLYNLKVKILKDINIMAEIAIKGLLV